MIFQTKMSFFADKSNWMVSILVFIFLCIFRSAGFADLSSIKSSWMVFPFGADFHVSLDQQDLQISSRIESN